jgi:hypothetical protein
MRTGLLLGLAVLVLLGIACGEGGDSSSGDTQRGTDSGASSGGDDGGGSSGGSGGSSGAGSSGASSGTGSSSGAGDGGPGADGGIRADGSAPKSDAGGLPTVGGLFTQPEPWTLDVSALAKDSRSDAIIAELVSLGGWGGTGALQIDFSIPLFFGNASTPRQTITKPAGNYCYGGTDCDPVPLQMPLPANGNTEGSANYTCDTTYATKGQGDCHVLVVEQDQKKLYELYNATKTATGFTALGAFVWDLTKAYPPNLRGDQCTSADAAGFPIAALLPTADEVAAGAVNHAIRFILPNPRMKMDVYVHPASHAGSPASTNANAPPYGVRFRLRADFDETSYSAGAKVILHAMKKYGMLLSDGGEVPLTFADDRTSTAKWAGQGITAQTFGAIAVGDFEVVALSPEIALTDNCVRNP